MRTEDDIKKEIAKLERPINKLRREYKKLVEAKKRKENLNLVGKTFIYRNNCYSGESERWNIYAKVVGLGNDLIIQSYQMNSQMIEIKQDSINAGISGYAPVSEEEFEHETERIKRAFFDQEKKVRRKYTGMEL